MEEIWKDIEGYEGLYQISNYGDVKSLDRDVYKSDGVIQHRHERIMSKRENSDGYYMAKLTVDKVTKNIAIHRLVAKAFIPNPDNLPEVNHKDCNRKNNHVDNLEWCSHKYNVHYAIQSGNHISTKDMSGCKNPNYGNHKLHEVYANNKALAVEKLARPGSQNGKSVAINLYDCNHTFVRRFDWIGGCAMYLKQLGITHAKVNSIRNNILLAIKKQKAYLGHYYTIA